MQISHDFIATRTCPNHNVKKTEPSWVIPRKLAAEVLILS